MRRLFVAFFLIGLYLPVQARQVITGVISDSETHQTIQGVKIDLLQLPDSVWIESNISNSEGLFLLYKVDTAQNYCLKFSYTFYKTAVKPLIQKKNSMINNIGAVELAPTSFNLKEIEINGSKMRVTEMADRTVYSVPEGIQKTSSDGVDVLRKIPSVQVDYLNEDITVNGRSNIRIEVDGISRDKGYLKRLHPSQISKMEIITNPSGKYDSEIDAVINIITNPAMRFGLKGMVYAGAFPIAKDSYLGLVNGSLDYGMDKISYYVAGNGILQHIGLNSDLQRQTGSDVLNQTSIQMLDAGVASINAGFIYDPNDKNDLNFNIAYNNTSYTIGNETWNSAFSSGLNSLSKTESTTKNTSGGLTTSLFYKLAFDKDKKHGLEAEINFYNSLGNKNNSDFRNSYMNPADSSLFFQSPWQQERSGTNVSNLYGQANYNLPLDSITFLNLGFSGNYNDYTTNNSSSLISSNNLNYTDLRVGGYAEISRSFSKGNIRLGSRFERSSVKVGTLNAVNYGSFLPYINGLYRFNTDNSLKISYSRRVLRPTPTQLNPFVSVVDSQTISLGNVNLKPAYRDNVDLTYNVRLPIGKSTFNIAPEVYYEYQTGLIQNVISPNPSTNLFESKPMNISNGYKCGGSLSINSQIGPVLFNSSYRYSFYHVDKYLNQIEARNQHGWSWNSYAMCSLPLNMQLIGVLYINGPILNGQSVTKSTGTSLLGIGKQFKNNSVVRLMAYNPFNTDFYRSRTTIDSPTFYQVQNSTLKKDVSVLLMYIYSFKLGQSIDREKRTIEQQTSSNIINLPINY